MSDLVKEEPPRGKIQRKCVFCQHDTAHKVLASVCEAETVTPEHERQTHYQVLQCQGCEKPYFQIVEVIICLIDPEDQMGSELDSGEAYPPPVELREPSPLLNDPGVIPETVWQVYLARVS